MMNRQQGFTLFEVLISMFIAGVAVLGLVMLEMKILRSSQSSFNYTLATIEANTLIDTTWMNLCDIGPAPGNYEANFITPWKNNLSDVNKNYSQFTGVVSSGIFTLNDSVVVSWVDKTSDSAGNNQVILNVSYPDFSAGCL